MKFSKKDISLLYGEQLFIVPPSVSAQQETSTPKTASEPKPVEIPSEEESPAKEAAKKKIRPPVIVPPFGAEGTAITWRMKPQANMVLILSSEEFSNRALTQHLKQCIEQAGIPTANVGFGQSDPTAQKWNLSDMPVRKGIFFISPQDTPLFQAIPWQEKQLYFAGPLSHLQKNAEATAQLVKLLTALKG